MMAEPVKTSIGLRWMVMLNAALSASVCDSEPSARTVTNGVACVSIERPTLSRMYTGVVGETTAVVLKASCGGGSVNAAQERISFSPSTV